MYNLEKVLGILASIVIAGAQLIYLLNTLKKKIAPSFLSWLGWAFLMGTTLVSQIVGKGWQWSLASILCSTIGCLAISGTAFFSKSYSYKTGDLFFLFLGLACVGVYAWSADPWITTIFAVVADALLGVPTIRNAWRDPEKERSVAWLLGVISATLALLSCIGRDPIYLLFPAYLFFLNGSITLLTRRSRIG